MSSLLDVPRITQQVFQQFTYEIRMKNSRGVAPPGITQQVFQQFRIFEEP